MCSEKARDAHQGSGRPRSLLDVGQKLGLLDKQGSVQVRALWLCFRAGGLTALAALRSPSLYMGWLCVLHEVK